MTRKISAHYLCLNSKTFLKYGVVTFFENGIIANIKDSKGLPEESESLEFFNGIIIPGFVDLDYSRVIPSSVYKSVSNLESLSAEFQEHIQFLILENPCKLDKTHVASLLALERNGLVIILKFSIDERNCQKSIFENICKLTGTIDFADALRWASINPAISMGVDNIYGSIAPGKKPGLNVISGIDYKTMNVTENTSIRVIV